MKLTGGKIVGDDVRGDVSCEHLESGRPFWSLWWLLQGVKMTTGVGGVELDSANPEGNTYIGKVTVDCENANDTFSPNIVNVVGCSTKDRLSRRKGFKQGLVQCTQEHGPY